MQIRRGLWRVHLRLPIPVMARGEDLLHVLHADCPAPYENRAFHAL
jgi:hypothetical protein